MCAIAVWGRCFDFIPRNPTRGDIPYSGVPTSRLPRLPRVPGWRGGPLAPCSSARGTRGTSLALEALRSHLLVPTHRKYTDRLSKSGCMLPCLLVGRSRKTKGDQVSADRQHQQLGWMQPNENWNRQINMNNHLLVQGDSLHVTESGPKAQFSTAMVRSEALGEEAAKRGDVIFVWEDPTETNM